MTLTTTHVLKTWGYCDIPNCSHDWASCRENDAPKDQVEKATKILELGPSFNADLAMHILNTITMLPSRHNQGDWTSLESYDPATDERPELCETTYCAAGWACVLEGGHFDTKDHHFRTATNNPILSVVDFDNPERNLYDTEAMHVAGIALYGKNQLGLTKDQAAYLFYDVDEAGARDFLGHLVELAMDRNPRIHPVSTATTYRKLRSLGLVDH